MKHPVSCAGSEGEKMRVKAVLFDLGGTLVKTAAIPEIYKRILGSFGIGVDPNQILEAHKANEKEFDVENGQIELGNAFWGQWNLKILRRLGVENNAEFLAKKIDELWWDYADLQFHPDVIVTLTPLSTKRIKMGIVTNGLKKDYEQILQRLEATSYFDVIVGIDTLNKAKPDRNIFLYAVERLRLKPSEVLFVGDSTARDYEGAKRAGLKPLLIDREGKALQNVDSIKSLTEVLLYF
jgi:putative hydrolase of the HAD superfamily